MCRLALALFLLLCALPAWAAETVGFAMIAVPDADAGPIEVGLWYPAADAAPRLTPVGPFMQLVVPGGAVRAGAWPLVVVSHGNGGAFFSHADTALALATAGFVVAAPTHPGDNFRDASRANDPGLRTRQLAAVVAHLAERWEPGRVDQGRIAAFGFSSGGFTVLAAAGARPDWDRLAPHCAAHPAFYDCRLLGHAPAAATPRLITEPRLRALVVAAPALGFTFGPGSLDGVRVPVQLWQAGEDAILPAPHYVEPVRAALPRPPEFHRVDQAGHFDFMAPCSERLSQAAPAICAGAPGFDRAAFHARFNAEVARFLSDALRP